MTAGGADVSESGRDAADANSPGSFSVGGRLSASTIGLGDVDDAKSMSVVGDGVSPAVSCSTGIAAMGTGAEAAGAAVSPCGIPLRRPRRRRRRRRTLSIVGASAPSVVAIGSGVAGSGAAASNERAVARTDWVAPSILRTLRSLKSMRAVRDSMRMDSSWSSRLTRETSVTTRCRIS